MSPRLLLAFLLWGLLFCIGNPIRADDTLSVSAIRGRLLLQETGISSILHQSSPSPNEILQHSGWQQFTQEVPRKVGGYYWLRLIVKNDLTDSTQVDFVSKNVDSIVVYKLDPTPQLYQVTGNYVKPHDWVVLEYPELSYVRLAPGEVVDLLFRLSAYRGLSFAPHGMYVQSPSHSYEEIVNGYRANIGKTEFNGFFLGGVCVMMVFFFFLYFWMNEKALLFYSIYLFGAASYALVVKSLPYSPLARMAYLDFELTYKLGEPLQYLFFAAYAWFAKHLLDIDKEDGLLYKFLKATTVALVVAGLALVVFNFINFNYSFQQKIFVWLRLILFPVAISMSIWICFAVKSPVKAMFIAGSSFFILGGLIAFSTDPKSNYLFFGIPYISSVLVFKTGILLESVCFALALGYKLRAIRIAKEKVTSAYIEQMELNRQLTATENERLERMVEERTNEILEKNTLLEKQKQQQMKSEYEKRISEMEMEALRSQMNPHFIFNSLNSIRHQILTKNYENASSYLVRFARLLRKILHNSRVPVIPLSEEIDLISLYLQLEKLRFGDLFEYHITITPDLDTERILIPSMLLQPFVENAIKHGIAASQRLPRRLDIRLGEILDGFTYIIEDNGIGREAAMNRKPWEEKAGLGLKITDERIALFNATYGQKIHVEFVDMKDENQEPLGTKVIITHKST